MVIILMPVFRRSVQIFCFSILSILMMCCLMGSIHQPALAIDLIGNFKEDVTLENGIHLYQVGQYPKSAKILESIHKDDPANLKATYYLAMNHAQLGHYAQARRLYQEVAMLDPQGPIGHYAKEGLTFLPAHDGKLDPPPRFQPATGQITATQITTAQPPAVQPTQMQTGIAQTPHSSIQQPANPNQATAEANGMSLQEWQSLQMMLGNGNNNNSMNGMGMNNMNMMPFMMGQGQGQGQTLDPNIMSTLMMNQMMQNMDLGGSNNNNNN